MNILIVYKHLYYPIRKTSAHDLFCFEKYSKENIFYLRLDYAYGKELSVPKHLFNVKFDAVLFHYGFSSIKFTSDKNIEEIIKKISILTSSIKIKVLFAQDEYLFTGRLNKLINKLNINTLFSVAPKSEWSKIYNNIDLNKVVIIQNLTGYIDDKEVENIDESDVENKTIDIGYRARNLPQWLGKHGYLKTKIANKFNEACSKMNIKTDISINPNDTLLGNRWFSFLLSCKYMIGVEGGATVLDADGEIQKKGEAFIKHNPAASFEDIEKACFPGLDGKLNLKAISPRHLECCFTKTCQILIEGEYNGILKPNVHYIPLKADFSNIQEVLGVVKKDNLRKLIVANCFNDIVKSKKYNYSTYVQQVLQIIKPNEKSDNCSSLVQNELVKICLFYNKWFNKYTWVLSYAATIDKWYFIEKLKSLKKVVTHKKSVF